MKHGHGTTSNNPKERVRRAIQPKREMEEAEANRQRALGGGKPNELGVLQGQNGEQGPSEQPRQTKGRTPVRH